MKPAIKVEGLGKSYTIAHVSKKPHATFREAMTDGLQRLVSREKRAAAPAASSEEFWAVNDLSFEIGVGERVGIIGRNGAGKSTLLKLLSRITAPTRGRITLQGRVASLLEVGTGFHPELTGRENVFVNGAILGMSRREIQRKYDEIVAFSDIERFLDTPVKRYSSGMYMRLAFAVAAHLDPDILLVDEVLAVGDAQFQAKCLGKMDAISREGRTVLFVSHNMSAVATLCDRAILLQKGQQALSGDVDTVVSRYLEAAVAVEDLAARTDRGGNGSARAVAVSFLSESGTALHSVASRQPMRMLVQIEAGADAIGKSLSINITVCDRAETRLFSLYTDWGEARLRVSRTRETFECFLPDGLPLVPDHYSMIIGINVNGILADKITGAMLFEVVAKDAFGTGAVPVSGLGPLLVPYKWRQAAET